MKRRMFLWLATLAPALLGAKKSFARRNEKLIVRETKKIGTDRVLVKEWVGGSIKLYRCYTEPQRYAVHKGEFFEISIDVDAYSKDGFWTKNFAMDARHYLEFDRSDLRGEIACWGWPHPSVLVMEWDNGAIELFSKGEGLFDVEINPRKLMQAREENIEEMSEYLGAGAKEWSQVYNCVFYLEDLYNKESTESKGNFTKHPCTPEQMNSIYIVMEKRMAGVIPY